MNLINLLPGKHDYNTGNKSNILYVTLSHSNFKSCDNLLTLIDLHLGPHLNYTQLLYNKIL